MSNWDKYFLDICNTVSTNSKCLSRKIGAIIIRDKSIISTGYNGPPRGVPDCSQRFVTDVNFSSEVIKRELDVSSKICPRKVLGYNSGEGLEWCPATHAEVNAIVNAARIGICVKDTIMYMNCGIPCKNCLCVIINSGITEIVVVGMTYYDDLSEYLIRESKLKVREYSL